METVLVLYFAYVLVETIGNSRAQVAAARAGQPVTLGGRPRKVERDFSNAGQRIMTVARYLGVAARAAYDGVGNGWRGASEQRRRPRGERVGPRGRHRPETPVGVPPDGRPPTPIPVPDPPVTVQTLIDEPVGGPAVPDPPLIGPSGKADAQPASVEPLGGAAAPQLRTYAPGDPDDPRTRQERRALGVVVRGRGTRTDRTNDIWPGIGVRVTQGDQVDWVPWSDLPAAVVTDAVDARDFGIESAAATDPAEKSRFTRESDAASRRFAAGLERYLTSQEKAGVDTTIDPATQAAANELAAAFSDHGAATTDAARADASSRALQAAARINDLFPAVDDTPKPRLHAVPDLSKGDTSDEMDGHGRAPITPEDEYADEPPILAALGLGDDPQATPTPSTTTTPDPGTNTGGFMSLNATGEITTANDVAGFCGDIKQHYETDVLPRLHTCRAVLASLDLDGSALATALDGVIEQSNLVVAKVDDVAKANLEHQAAQERIAALDQAGKTEFYGG